MSPIRKRILTDESNRPVAVQIDYGDWLQIERALGIAANGHAQADLSRFAGSIRLSEDPVEFQQRVRNEWR